MATSLRPLRPSESAQQAFPGADCRVGRPPSSPLPLLISAVPNVQAVCGNECKERRVMWLRNWWEDWVTGKSLYLKGFPNNPPWASDHTLRNAATSPAIPKGWLWFPHLTGSLQAGIPHTIHITPNAAILLIASILYPHITLPPAVQQCQTKACGVRGVTFVKYKNKNKTLQQLKNKNTKRKAT